MVTTAFNAGYQAEDKNIVDYEFWEIEGLERSCRGPKVELERPYFSCVGAAQTFGRFVTEPYPTLLARELGVAALNLGFSGAGPNFFLRRPRFFELINKGTFCIVQVLSGRSVDNSIFETGPNQGTLRLRDATARKDDRFYFAEYVYQEYLRTASTQALQALRTETQQNYIKLMKELLARITVPKVLLYFSRRFLAYNEGVDRLLKYWGDFPHFVNKEVIAALAPHADAYVEVVSHRGLPQPLLHRQTGEPVTIWDEQRFPHVKLRSHNHYYPSPEMHKDAASALTKTLANNAQLLGAQTSILISEKTDGQRQVPHNGRMKALHANVAPAGGALPRLCFIHIPKCSGNSVLDYLFDLYGRDATFLSKTHIPFNEDYCVQDPSALATYRLYPGHIYWQTVVTRLPQDTITFTLLREPVDRLLSLFFFWRGMKKSVARTFGDEAYEAVLLTQKLDILDWLQCDNRFIRNTSTNAYARYLVTGPVLHRGNLDEIIEEGKRNLEACIQAGTVENAEINLAILCAKLGAPKKARLSWLNASKRSQFSPSERARLHTLISDISPIDFLLYEHARRLESQALKDFLLDKEGA